MNLYSNLGRWLLESAELGEIQLTSAEQHIAQALVSSQESSTSTREMLLTNIGFTSAFGSALARRTVSLCNDELQRLTQLRKTRSLSEAERDYLVNVLFPLYNEALKLGIRAEAAKSNNEGRFQGGDASHLAGDNRPVCQGGENGEEKME